MATITHLHQRVRQTLEGKIRPSGWVLKKQSTMFSDPDKWSNIDADVTPVERRKWTSVTLLGFWISVLLFHLDRIELF